MTVGENRVRAVPQRNRATEEPTQRVKASHKLPEGFPQPFWRAHPSDVHGPSAEIATSAKMNHFGTAGRKLD